MNATIIHIVICSFCLTVAHAGPLFSFQGADGHWQSGAMAVGNIDSDSDLEFVIPYRDSAGEWFLAAFDHMGQLMPGFPFETSEPANLSPTLVDMDGDGDSEIFFAHGTSVIALDGDGSVVWQQTVDRTNYVPDSGYMVTPGGFWMGNPAVWSTNLPASAEFYNEVSPPMVQDVDGDGDLEVLTSWKIDPDGDGSGTYDQDYEPEVNDYFGFADWGTVGESWSGGVVLMDATTGAIEYIYHIHQLVESGLAIGQVDSDSALEIFCLNDSDSIVCFDKTQPHGFFGNGNLHGMFGKNQRLMSGTYKQGVDVNVGDIDGDGRDEVLIATMEEDTLWQPHETILDDDGAIMWRDWKQEVMIDYNQGWWNSVTMFAVNPDRDNRADVFSFCNSHKIYFREWNGSELVTRAGWPKDFSPLIPSPPVVGDVDGDGEEEIIIGTHHPTDDSVSGELHVYDLDGTEEASITVTAGVKHIPFLADINGDGDLDVAYQTLLGRVYVHNFGAGDPNRVSWASHRGNAERTGKVANLYPAGTPLVPVKEGGYGTASFSWEIPTGFSASAVRIYRAGSANGPYVQIANLAGSTTDYVDTGLTIGQLYFYEVAAVYGSSEVRSVPFTVLSNWENNLIANGGFEADDDSHWDQWYNGGFPWERIEGSSAEARSGSRSMEAILEDDDGGDTIRQFNPYGTPDSWLPVTPGKLYSFGGFIKTTGLTSATEHQFEWSTSPSGSDPSARPLPEYPNYFTPQVELSTTPTDWVYLNRVFELQSGISNIGFIHDFDVSGTASGSVFLDDLFFREVTDPSDPAWESWIAFGAGWRYAEGTAPANWFAVGFDDSSWSEGFGKFGSGGGPDNINWQLTPMESQYYFRHGFSLSSLAYKELLLEATCTDDSGGTVYPLEIWVNGQELVTSGIEAVSGEGNDVKYYDLTPFLPLFQLGSNTLAVKLNNRFASSWDNVAFDVSIKGIPAAAPPVLSGYALWASTQIPNGDQSALGDADGDGTPNLLEYAFVTDPLSGGKVEPMITLNGTAMEIMFRRRVGAPGVTYRLEGSDDLADWNPIASAPEISAVANGDGSESVTLAPQTSASFLRICVELAP